MHIHFLLVRRLQNQTKELSLGTNFKLGTRDTAQDDYHDFEFT